MNGTKYTKADPSVQTMIEKVLTKYDQKFSHLRSDMFVNVFKESQKSTWLGRIRLTSGFLKIVVEKPIVLEIWKEHWEGSTDNQRAYIIYHELCHVIINDKTGEFKLRGHDIQDFSEVITQFGLAGEKIEHILE